VGVGVGVGAAVTMAGSGVSVSPTLAAWHPLTTANQAEAYRSTITTRFGTAPGRFRSLA
jgi:hypothetical protein